MKKLLPGLMLLLFSCNNNKDDIPHTDELVATVWSTDNEERTYTVFYFALNKNCTRELRSNGELLLTYKLKYEIHGERLTLNHLTGAVYGTGTIQDRSLTFRHKDGEDFIFQRIR